MKKSTLFVLLLLTFSFGFSQTTLVAGEVAITGVNADNPDQFSFVLLTDVVTGTEINFTDTGWLAAGGFVFVGPELEEGIITWTATIDLPCGTEIIIEEIGIDTYSASSGTATETDDGFVLASAGDQIIAFQGTAGSPTPIYALHFANGDGWAADSEDTNTSAIPTGLTEGTNAVAIIEDNIVYNYNTLGDSAAILAALVDPSQWSGDNVTRQTLGLPSGDSFSCDIVTTTLSPGDVAITGANADNPDQFSFVLLTDVVAGTEINFTDTGWLAAGGFVFVGPELQEGIVTWTATIDLPCGTEIIIEEIGIDTYSASSGTATETDDGFVLASAGDQIIAFQGTAGSPTPIYALHFANGDGWAADSEDTNTSAIPTGLTEGTNAVAIIEDNIVYNYNTLGDSAAILAALVDPSQWSGDNVTRQTLGLPSGDSFSCDIVTTTLSPGDVAITGVNADNPDQFSFVLLTDVVAGTEINFTDTGWLAAGGFVFVGPELEEGIITWTATIDLPCGTEIIIEEIGIDTYSASSGTATETDDGFVLASAGDQIIAFQGTAGSPTPIYALHFANGDGWAADSEDTNTSAIPTGLTEGTNAVAIIEDNIVYNYNTLGDSAAILAALVDPSQWSGDNVTRQTLGLPSGDSFSCDIVTTTLSPGDVAITGANADNPDQFSFVLLTDVVAGTEINFTDTGWLAAGGFVFVGPELQEGIVTWTATIDLPCGTEIIIEEIGIDTYSASSGTATETDDGFVLASAGDQIIAFQGTAGSPTPIYALHFANGDGWAADSEDTNTSAIPTGLTEGTNAVAIIEDNIVYNYNTLGDSAAILAALVDPSQWSGDNVTRQTLGLPSGDSFSCDIVTTTLSPGDVAITGANADNPDQFSFVLLTDVVAGTEINFTDTGWLAAGGFVFVGPELQEGIVTWTATIDLPCGTEIIIEEIGIDTYSASSGTATETDDGFVLASAGDQIIAFQGTAGSPTPIYALHFANGDGWAADSEDTNTSAIPTGLTEGTNAVAIIEDNIVYNYNTLGDSAAILAALVDPSQWSGDNVTRQTLGLPSGDSFSCDIVTTTLSPGDVAITGANADNPDQFSFVLLTDVVAGTEINFTDTGWLAAGGFVFVGPELQEGIVTWTATIDLPCGTEIIIEEIGIDTYSASSGTATETDDGFVLASAGDQIIAFQGTAGSPTPIYALHFANGDGFTDATDENTSAVPAGLTEGINAVAINLDNLVYDYSVIDNQDLILAATVNPSNWSGSNAIRQNLGLPMGVSFSCTTPGACFDLISWNGTVWTPIIGSKTFPDIATSVIIGGDYDTSINPSFTACNIEIFNGFTLTVANDTFIVVENDIEVNGNLIVETRGNFVQNDDGGNVTIGPSGSCTLNKTTPIKNEWYYYTYWGSPMANETIGNVFPFVLTDRRFSYNAANFLDNSPTDNVDDNNDDWEIAAGVDTMIPGVGYAVTAERGGAFPRADNISFTGTFNTGDIPVAITFDPTNLGIRWNFISNPYPSAVDFVSFHLANSSVVEGVAYFWSQASPPLASNPGNDGLNFNPDDYAVFNVGVGGTDGGGAGVIPNGYVPSAQGFFIPALSIGTATFTNAMRTPDNTSNSQFFKTAGSKKSNPNIDNPLENRLWIDLTSDNGVFNQILIGYVDNATDDYDGMSYDAPKILSTDFAAVLYSSIESDDAKYVIQGKDINSINENEVIKIGYSVTIQEETEYTLSISQLQGDFLTENSIYLNDNLLNIQHNLSDGDYTFTSEVGEFNSRFEIVFNTQSLSTDDIVTDANTLRIIELYDDQVQFNISNNLTIKSVSIYDLLGRQLYNFEGNTSSETYKFSNLSNTTYIVKVELSNGTVITKKMIKK